MRDNRGKEMNNLKDIHIKCGLSLEKDGQIFTLKHHSHTIARYPTNGIISVYEIHRDADDYIAKEVKRGEYCGRK